jgi:hypothetical protein
VQVASGTYYENIIATKILGAPSFANLWSYTTGFRISSSPSIGSDGTIYGGSVDGLLYAFGAAQPPIYTLTYTAGANGSITGTSPQTVNDGADGTAVPAVPDAGYYFDCFGRNLANITPNPQGMYVVSISWTVWNSKLTDTLEAIALLLRLELRSL